MKKSTPITLFFALIALFSLSSKANAQTTINVGAASTYQTIQSAYDAGITAPIAGAFIIELQSDYNPALDTYPINLTAKAGASAENSITIKPATGVTKTLSTAEAQSVWLNGAQFVTIDGVSKTGSTQLVLDNTNTAAAQTILFSNDASNNTIKNATVKGVSAVANNGTIFISIGTGTGNDNNVIDNCDITDGTTLPATQIYLNGSSATITNDNNIISNCNISNFGLTTLTSSKGGGIFVDLYTSGTKIRNNRLFLSKDLTMTFGVAFSFVTIAGTDSEVSANIIGFGAADGTGISKITQSGTSNLALAGIVPKISSSSCVISNNIIGGFDVSCMYFSGILAQAALSSISITGNTIKDIKSISTLLQLSGIYYQNNTSTIISNNIISGLTNENVSDGAASLTKGIFIAANSSSACTITGNKISNLISGKSTSTAANQVFGIEVSKNTSVVEKNLIYNINAINNTNTAIVTGIKTTGGSDAGLTIKNNMVRLGTDVSASALIYGIYQPAATATTNKFNIYHNSIYIGGTAPAASTVSTYAYNRTATGNVGVIDLRNNILSNQRVVGGSEKNYAVGVALATDLGTCNYNIYQFSGQLGAIGATDKADLTAWKGALTPANDANSLVVDPKFHDATNAVLPDLHCGNKSAVDVAGDNLSAVVTDDFDGQSRTDVLLTPHDIGADADNFLITGVQSMGSVSVSSIYALGEGVLITEAAGNTAAIYTVTGQLVKSVEIASDKVFVSLSKGFYIISVKDQKVKVLVK